MTVSDQSFGKSYRLCSKKIIDDLFLNGETTKMYPLIARYSVMSLSTDEKFQVAVTVPKKNFKRAVDRNRIKRVLREAIRCHKSIIEGELQNRQLAIFIIYSSKEELPLATIKAKMEKLFQKTVASI